MESRAFPLRPVADPSVRFAGTYRAEAWRRCGAIFARLHLRLYEAFFTESRNIADREEVMRIVAEAGCDMARFAADYASGIGREAVQSDFEAAMAEGVRSIPTVIVAATGRSLVGLADLTGYRAAVEAAAG